MNAEKSCPHCGKSVSASALRGLCPDCLLQAALPTGDTGDLEADAAPSFEPPSPQELGQKFPLLEIVELLGRGGMGAVYKARQKHLDRVVALKILPPKVGQEPAFAARFEREARALAKLTHPNIVTLYEFGQAEGLYYFLMEYVDGVNLSQLLQAGRLAPKAALAIVPHICEALQYAHDQGIVHRDIKPGNILLGKNGQVKIADFGVAKLMGADPLTPPLAPIGGAGGRRTGEGEPPMLTDAGKIIGTPHYMAPEQTNNPQEVDHRADIYSLGVVFYQMLTGELPGKTIEPPSKKVHMDVRLDEVVLRALEKKPELRYQQASVLKTQVETIAESPSGSSGRNDGQFDSALEPEHNPYATVWPKWMSVTTVRDGRPLVRWSGVWIGLAILGAVGWGVTVAVNALFFGSRPVSDWVFLMPLLMAAGYLAWRIHWNLERLQHRLRSRAGQSPKAHTTQSEIGIPAGGATASSPSAPLPIKSPLVRVVEAWFNLTLTSPLAEKLINVSSLGFFASLGFLSLLGFLPLPGWQRCFGFSGFFGFAGFFGLIGVAFMVEFAERRKAKSATAPGSSSPDWWLWAPAQSSLVREICGHLTDAEKSEATKRRFLFGIWNAMTFFGPFFSVMFLPSPLGWIFGGAMLVIGLSFYPLWRRMEREFLYSTIWARQQGIQLEQLKGGARPRHIGLFVAAALLVLLIAGGFLGYQLLHSPKPAGPEAVALGFGPVMEQVVDEMIDFDSGKLAKLPDSVTSANSMVANVLEALAWAEKTGMDAVKETSASFLGLGMKVETLHGETWENVTPDQLARTLATTKPKTTQAINPGKDSPATYAFQTREGGIGIMQVIGFTDKGVKLRYKLVR
ncbi:MAG: serine/threonine-protein kinase [Verrucomicrobiota bacterium]